MSAYTFQAPAGVPGDVTRTDETNVEQAMLIAVGGVFPSAFGIPVKYVTGGIQQFNGGAETKASFAGVLIREVPSIAGDVASDAVLNPTTPYSKQIQGLAVRGYVAVICSVGTPTRGGVVYVQIVANAGVAVGSFRADGTDSGNAVALDAVQAEWASDGKDGNSIAELRIAR